MRKVSHFATGHVCPPPKTPSTLDPLEGRVVVQLFAPICNSSRVSPFGCRNRLKLLLPILSVTLPVSADQLRGGREPRSSRPGPTSLRSAPRAERFFDTGSSNLTPFSTLAQVRCFRSALCPVPAFRT